MSDSGSAYGTGRAIWDALRLTLLGFGLTLNVLFAIAILIGPGWSGVFTTYTVTIFIVVGCFQLSAIFGWQIYVLVLCWRRKKLPKKQMQAVEYVYLVLGLLSLLGVIGTPSELDSQNALEAAWTAHSNLGLATSAIDEGLGACRQIAAKEPDASLGDADLLAFIKRTPPADLLQSAASRTQACAWLQKADIFLDGSKSERGWKRISPELDSLIKHNESELRRVFYPRPANSVVVGGWHSNTVTFNDLFGDLSAVQVRMSYYFTEEARHDKILSNIKPAPLSDTGLIYFFSKIFAPFILAYAVGLRLAKLTAEFVGIVE